MARKQELLGSSIGIEPMLTAPWTAEKQQSLEKDLRTAMVMLEKPELTAAEVARTGRQLHYLRQQLPKNPDVFKLSGVLAHRIRQHEEAERLTRQALALNPQDPDLYGNLAIALRAQQRIHEAQTVLQDALETVPGSAALHRNLGNVFSDQGAYEAAAASYRASLRIRPAHRETWMSYSFALARTGDLAKAVQALHEAAAQGFDECEMLRTVGQWLLAQSRGSQAVGVFARALQFDDEEVQSLFGMGLALMQASRPKDAERFFDMVLDQDENHVPALSQKGSIALSRHQRQAAREYIERALEIAPQMPGLKVDMASVLFQEDDLDGAERLCREALRMAPGLPPAYGMLSQIARTNGDFDASRKYAEKVIELAPQKGGALSSLYASKKDISEDDDVAGVLARLEAQETTSQRDLTAYYYTLGELFHKLKSPERAIFFLKAGNDFRRIALKSEGHVYDRKHQEAVVSRNIQLFTKDRLDRRDCGLDSRRPVFIVGMPRSGTTLTEQIISSHPLAFGAGELPKVPEMVGQVTREVNEAGFKVGFPGWTQVVEDGTYAQLAQAYLDYIAELNADALRVTDKMPHNFMNVGLIATMFPNAAIIHVQRDPVDNCLSCFQQNFAMPHTYSTTLADLGHHYREYRRLMAHWRAVLGDRMYEVRYEDLVADQERVSRKLIDFVGLEWDDACLAFNKQERAVKTASVWQVRQPIYKSSVKKWKMYEGYIDELLDALGPDIVED
jgi:tetratricopeptide (TPR) repeat protein